MKILVARGNPRKNGYTQRLTDLFVEGATAGGGRVDNLDLTTVRIKSCLGCYHCWRVTPGVCIHDDDMRGILERILDAEALVCATPLYHYSMNSCLKRFLERTLPLTAQGFEFTPRGYMRNVTRHPERWKNKKVAFIAAGAFRHPGNFDGLTTTFRLLAEGMNARYAGGLIRPEAYLLQFALAKPKTVKTVESAFVKAGRELAAEGAISAESMKNAALPLSGSLQLFRLYSNIYWEHATALGSEGADLEKVQREVVTDVRILMQEMARSIDPVAAARLTATLQFDFPDKDLHFRISVDHGRCTIEQTASDTCDLRVTTSTDTWARVFMREISVRDALVKKDILLKGDKSLFSRLDRYFPPPVS
jgi:multimeric flavodoxin WrbA